MRTRFGELPRETQKAINAVSSKRAASGGCESEMGMFLRCIKRADWDTSACMEQLEALEKCAGTGAEVVSVVGACDRHNRLVRAACL